MADLSVRIEVRDPVRGEWFCPAGDRSLPRGYAEGYFDAVSHGPTPRLAHRMVRNRDGMILRELDAIETVGIGMVAGWPTWQQYARAAVRALERAASIAVEAEDAAVDTGGRLRSAALDVVAAIDAVEVTRG